MGLQSHVNKAANSFKIPSEPMGTKMKFDDESNSSSVGSIKKKASKNNKIIEKKKNIKKIQNEKKQNKINKIIKTAKEEKSVLKKKTPIIKNDSSSKIQVQKRTKKTLKLPSKKASFSVCVGTSIISSCKNLEQITFVLYQVAKACTIYNVNEIVILNDAIENREKDTSGKSFSKTTTISTILQYFITPDYLVKSTFKKTHFPLLKHCEKLQKISTLPFNKLISTGNSDLKKESRLYKEGISVSMEHPNPTKRQTQSYDQTKYIQIGEAKLLELANQIIPKNVRVTVNVEEKKIVSPKEAYGAEYLNLDGDNFGYILRACENIEQMYLQCPKKDGYDQTIFVNCGDLHSKSFKTEKKRSPLLDGVKISDKITQRDSENPTQVLLFFNSWFTLTQLFEKVSNNLQGQLENIGEIFDLELPVVSHIVSPEDAILASLSKLDM
ncbi:hypothetical protein QEN19_002498 [Hanseniaspora menglaensis]